MNSVDNHLLGYGALTFALEVTMASEPIAINYYSDDSICKYSILTHT